MLEDDVAASVAATSEHKHHSSSEEGDESFHIHNCIMRLRASGRFRSCQMVF
jgi:hypothetical protein